MMIYISYVLFGTVLFFSSCSMLPELAKSVEEIATDEAIYVEIDKAAMQKDTNIHINVDVSKAP